MRRFAPALLLLLPACGEPAAEGPPTAEEQARLVAARDALLQRLSGRLVEALAEGPRAGIAVCAEEAVPLTGAVAAEHGVRMGRTSHRLRNPENTPPDWADGLLAERPEEGVFRRGPGGEARAFLPIRLQARCVMCHGETERIPEPVRAALGEHYPDDEATGFEVGEVRGYVWVESD